MTELLKDITDRHILGIPVAHIHVDEFHKRDLPHAHMLIILHQSSKLRDEVDVDTLISAEIPDATVNRVLHDIVKSCMIHGPCGVLKPQAVCMEKGECSKGFPKMFCASTILNHDGYPHYRRRYNSSFVSVAGYDLDNRWVVPYNPWLC